MPDQIHVRKADHVEVHQVAVVGQQIVGAPLEPPGIFQVKRKRLSSTLARSTRGLKMTRM